MMTPPMARKYPPPRKLTIILFGAFAAIASLVNMITVSFRTAGTNANNIYSSRGEVMSPPRTLRTMRTMRKLEKKDDSQGDISNETMPLAVHSVGENQEQEQKESTQVTDKTDVASASIPLEKKKAQERQQQEEEEEEAMQNEKLDEILQTIAKRRKDLMIINENRDPTLGKNIEFGSSFIAMNRTATSSLLEDVTVTTLSAAPSLDKSDDKSGVRILIEKDGGAPGWRREILPVPDASSYKAPTRPSPITLVGMAHADSSITTAALHFLVEAACAHQMEVFVLVERMDSNLRVRKELDALAHLWHLDYPKRGDHARSIAKMANLRAHDKQQGKKKMIMEQRDLAFFPHPACLEWIHIEKSPPDDMLMKYTQDHLRTNVTLKGMNSPTNNPLASGRIAKIKRSREYLRYFLQEITSQREEAKDESQNVMDKRNSVIALMDFDLLAYPTPSKLLEEAAKIIPIAQNSHNNDTHLSNVSMPLQQESHQQTGQNQQQQQLNFHAICSNGVQVRKSLRSYYDTFATILLPNTWLFYKINRLPSRQNLQGEDENLRKMSQEEMFEWFSEEGRRQQRRQQQSEPEQSPINSLMAPVPVRSCFGGLTLYRADLWIDSPCRYDDYHPDDLWYVGKREDQACEHVVFHECLRRRMMGRHGGVENDGFRIAVQPDMNTLFHFLG